MNALGDRIVRDDKAPKHGNVVEQAPRFRRGRNPSKPVDDLLLAHVPTLPQRRLRGKGPSFGAGGPGLLGDGVEQAVDEAALALVVERVRDIDIFRNDRAQRDVGPGN
jgi:hypothetical protein